MMFLSSSAQRNSNGIFPSSTFCDIQIQLNDEVPIGNDAEQREKIIIQVPWTMIPGPQRRSASSTLKDSLFLNLDYFTCLFSRCS